MKLTDIIGNTGWAIISGRYGARSLVWIPPETEARKLRKATRGGHFVPDDLRSTTLLFWKPSEFPEQEAAQLGLLPLHRVGLDMRSSWAGEPVRGRETHPDEFGKNGIIGHCVAPAKIERCFGSFENTKAWVTEALEASLVKAERSLERQQNISDNLATSIQAVEADIENPNISPQSRSVLSKWLSEANSQLQRAKPTTAHLENDVTDIQKSLGKA